VGVSLSDTALDWLTLAALPGIGRATLSRLALRYGTPSALLKEAPHDAELKPRLRRLLSERENSLEARKKAEQQLETLAACQVSLVCYGSPLYPASLCSLSDPPLFLYYRGDLSLVQKPVVALVGSRAATSYGREVSYRLAKDLARQGIVVVSGVALGVDAQAHRGALAAGGLTIGVLGCGIDVTYPKANKDLYVEIAAHGLLLSEYPCGTRPDGFRFPARNRIISGLASGVVVVEAGLKSGSLITARLALDQGREVFAVPGRIDSARSEGTHWLLSQGACLAQSAANIIEELGFTPGASGQRQGGREKGAPADEEERCVLACLDVYPVDIDTIVRVTGLSTSTVLQSLLQLELQGLVRQHPGQMYEKVLLE